jgi:hypothetical protein
MGESGSKSVPSPLRHARTNRASSRNHQALVDEEHLCCPKLPCSLPAIAVARTPSQFQSSAFKSS